MIRSLLLLLTSLILAFSTIVQAEQRFQYYDHIPFYDVYAGTVCDTLPNGFHRINNSRITTLLSAADLDQMGDSIELVVTIHPLCDNYDRIGSIDLVLMPKDSLSYSDCCHAKPNGGYYLGRLGETAPDIQRIEVARFITPFMDKNKGIDAPYHWNISFLSPLFHDTALRDTMNLWLEFHVEGVPYAANTQIAGCAGRNDVFAGSLVLVTSDRVTKSSNSVICQPLAYERYLNTYQTTHTDEAGTLAAHYQVHIEQPLSDAMFVMINSNHGANSGGEEYNRRLHYIWVNEWMAEVYRPGRISCEPFRQYNTQSNGIYGGAAKTDEAWQSFSNWCPGDVIDHHIIRLGSIAAGDYDFRLLVPDAVFTGNEGYFPFSLTFLGLNQGQFQRLEQIGTKNEPTTHLRWEKDQLYIDSGTLQITHWTLLNAAGQRLQVQPGAANRIDMSQRECAVYILLLLMDDGSVETHKFFKQ